MLYSKKLKKRRLCLNFEECQMIALTNEYCGYCKRKYELTGTRQQQKKHFEGIKHYQHLKETTQIFGI